MKKTLKIITIFFLILFTSFYTTTFFTKAEKNTHVPVQIQTKIDGLLEKFYKKLDNKYSENSKKILILEKINSRIEDIRQKKKPSIKFVNILNYLQEKIKQKIEYYKNITKNEKIYWYNINWSFLPKLDNTKIEIIKELKTDIIRYPGGTVSQYWDWEKWISTKNPNRTAHKLNDLAKLQKATNAKVIFVLNMITSDLDNQIKMLKQAQNLWIKIEYLEMWNEFYLSWEKHSDYVKKFPTAREYVNTLNSWTQKLKQTFPNVKIWVVMTWREINNKHWKDWNKIVGNNAKNFDAFVYHIYSTWDTLKDVENRIARYKAVKFQDSSKQTWITEYGAHSSNKQDKIKLTEKLIEFVKKEAQISLIHFLYKKFDDPDSFALIKADFSWLTKLWELFNNK